MAVTRRNSWPASASDWFGVLVADENTSLQNGKETGRQFGKATIRGLHPISHQLGLDKTPSKAVALQRFNCVNLNLPKAYKAISSSKTTFPICTGAILLRVLKPWLID